MRTSMSTREDSPEAFAAKCKTDVMALYARLPDETFANLEKSQDLTAFIRLSSNLKNFVLSKIMEKKEPEGRAEYISYFINVIRECVRHNDYYTASTIMGALNSYQITNLSATQALIGEEDRLFMRDIAYFLGSGKNLVYAEMSREKNDFETVPSIPAVRSIYVAYNEAINQNLLLIFRDCLYTDMHKQEANTPGAEMVALLDKKTVFKLLSEMMDLTRDPEKARGMVLDKLEERFRAILVKYQEQFDYAQLRGDKSEKLKSLDYERDIKGKMVRIVDAASLLRGVGDYALRMRDNFLEKRLDPGDSVYADRKETDEKQMDAAIDSAYKTYKDTKKERKAKDQTSVPLPTPTYHDVLALEGVISGRHILAFYQAELISQEKVRKDKNSADRSSQLSDVDKQTIDKIRQLEQLISQTKSKLPRSSTHQRQDKWKQRQDKWKQPETSPARRDSLRKSSPLNTPSLRRRGDPGSRQSSGISSSAPTPQDGWVRGSTNRQVMNELQRGLGRGRNTSAPEPVTTRPRTDIPGRLQAPRSTTVSSFNRSRANSNSTPEINHESIKTSIDELKKQYDDAAASSIMAIIKESQLSSEGKRGFMGELYACINENKGGSPQLKEEVLSLLTQYAASANTPRLKKANPTKRRSVSGLFDEGKTADKDEQVKSEVPEPTSLKPGGNRSE